MIFRSWREAAIALAALLTGLAGPGLFGISHWLVDPLVLCLLGALGLLVLLFLVLSRDEVDVDIWKLQARLMAISGQEQPDHPEFTHTGVLYLALITEELGEMAEHVAKVLTRLHSEASWGSKLTRNWHVIELCMHVKKMAEDLGKMSDVAKTHLKHINQKDLQTMMTHDEVKAILDDTTDLAVVVAGASLAMGMPGAAGYVNVQESNWSKRDPETGLIMKTDTGKWIKGPNYKEPDLDSVLDRQQIHGQRCD